MAVFRVNPSPRRRQSRLLRRQSRRRPRLQHRRRRAVRPVQVPGRALVPERVPVQVRARGMS